MIPTSGFQFERTRPLRAWVYREARLARRRRVAEVGAGEGRVASEMAARTGQPVLALDLAPGPGLPGVVPILGDAHRLPCRDGSLDAVAFHFALLWIEEPVPALCEVRRVLAPGGIVLLLSEPDICRRVEWPETGLGELLAEAVRAAGGEPEAASRLDGWLREAGFRPCLLETQPHPVEVENAAELLHECDFLGRIGLDASGVREKVREVYSAGGSVRVTLPLAYGWAVRDDVSE